MIQKPAFSHEAEKAMSRRIGENLRSIRELRGFSQSQIGDELGVTFQQVQKYEKGTNRLSLAKAAILAGIFNMPLDAFIHGPDAAAGLPGFEKADAPRRRRMARILKVMPAMTIADLDMMEALCRLARTRIKTKGD